MQGLWRWMLAAALIGVAAAVIVTPVGPAFAGTGQPSPWQVGFQGSVTPVMDAVAGFHDYLLWVISAIVIFVLALLVTVIVRFNSRVNPTPSRTTHSTPLEVAWTLVPIIILGTIAVPSIRLLYQQQTIPPADLTVKATGKQWYWTYSYPDNGSFEFDSLLLQDSDRKPDQPRLLAVDNAMVVPVDKVVRVQTTGADVIHSFAVPSFGIKIDAVPGRLNETWFKATREGIYYGQCSELCGRDHAFMPIEVHVVSDAEFTTWLDQAKKKFAGNGPIGATTVAQGW